MTNKTYSKLVEVTKSLSTLSNTLCEFLLSLNENDSDVAGVTATPVLAEVIEEIPVVVNQEQNNFDSMSFSALKEFAKAHDIESTGSRAELISRLKGEDEKASVEEKVVEDSSSDSSEENEESNVLPIKQPQKRGRKKKIVEEEPEEVEEEIDPLVEKVNEAVKDMSNEEIADCLVDAGISASGKRESLIAKVVKAVRDGKIDLEDDEEPEEEKATEKSEKYIIREENDLENADMTEERKKALIKLEESLRKKIAKGSIDRNEMLTFVTNLNEEWEKQLKEASDEYMTEFYIDVYKLFIDDDGEEVEMSNPYNVNGLPFCCGTQLDFDAEKSAYICSCCGEQYEENNDDEEE